MNPLQIISKHLQTHTNWITWQPFDSLTIYSHHGLWLGSIYHQNNTIEIQTTASTTTTIPLADPELYQKIQQILAIQCR